MSFNNESDDNNNARNQGLISFNSALERYIKKNIAYDFHDGDDTIKTSVLFTKPEQWSDVKDSSKHKVTIGNDDYNLPLISLNRTDIILQKSRVPHWLDDELVQYAIATLNKPTIGDKEYTETVLDRRGFYLEVYFTVEILAENHMHYDHLIEQFILHESKYWNDGENFSMRVTYDSFPNTSQSADREQERIISTSFNLQMNGQILPKYRKEKNITNVRLGNNIKVNFTEKIID